MTMDEDPSHPHATSVVAKVNYTYGASLTRSADGSAPVPLSSAPTFTLSGIVTEENTNGRAVASGTVQVVDGPNAGKELVNRRRRRLHPDESGGRQFLDPRERKRLQRDRARGDGRARHQARCETAADSGVTGTWASTATGRLLWYTITPTTTGTVGYQGGNFTASISRTVGSCAWQAGSDVNWITFPSGASGNGSATLAYTVAMSGSLNSRSGNITISWAGGSARIQVQQGNYPDWYCVVSVTKGPQDFDTRSILWRPVDEPCLVHAVPSVWNQQCSASINSNVTWIAGGGTVNGGGPEQRHQHVHVHRCAQSPARRSAKRITCGHRVSGAGGSGGPQTVAVTQR